jgi:hypothetical protein
MWRVLAVVVGLSGEVPAWADSFTIALKAQTGDASQSAQEEPVAIGVQPKVRKVLEGKAGQPVKVHWTLTNTSTKTVMKNILVHFFAVKQDALGQRQVPKLTRDVAAESALTMDFNPGEKAQGSLTFTVGRPGFYLIRVETIGAPDGEECFAALDLVAK